MTTQTAELYDDGDINAVYQAIKGRFETAKEAWEASLAVVAVVTNRLIQKNVDEGFSERASFWLENIYEADKQAPFAGTVDTPPAEADWEVEYMVEDAIGLIYFGPELEVAKSYLRFYDAKITKHLSAVTDWEPLTEEELNASN